MQVCPLCFSKASKFFTTSKRTFYQCLYCKGIFVPPVYFLSSQEEKERYQTHENDVNNVGYQKFVEPLVQQILKYTQPTDKGLDYGCGTGPVAAKLLRENGYDIQLYDPFFKDDKGILEKKYDFIFSCEVIEHFHKPQQEFTFLSDLLKPNGKLFCRTAIYSEKIDFENWYYKNDLTHVFFYHKKSFAYIRQKFDYKNLEIINDSIVYLEK
ncbi:class I SAM-dependent methyltransferase [Haloflavibacter putidus]|uniref:Class I SAM-dependent methyltransferase n=1 Tax=Haloflavibacter putidus TaxID=2576776 RepID=A0A508A4B6_9FLAO|nr:class I SAM-dependent methyltransferase [Haloflavibacter putidus]